jgi:glutamine synthetase
VAPVRHDVTMHENGNAEELAAVLAERGVLAVALTWVDNAGVTRVKTVPVSRLGHAAERGIGMSPVFDVFLATDAITTSRHIGGPTGDLRLHPDLRRITALAAQPGWAWAPVDRRTQDGEPYPACQRTFARRAVHEAEERGLSFRMAFEVEWFVGTGESGLTPGCTGPAYGMTRVVELSAYVRDLLRALDEQGVPVDQFHPEYADGQLELSVGATDPVAAADRLVLVRQTIRAVSFEHGLRASFAPVVIAGSVGNGCHLHVSASDADGQALFAGGDGRHGLTKRGESVLAGWLRHLPALCAIGAPSVTSYLRLVPQHWAAPWHCWGLENREAALRFVPSGSEGANAELKCFDGSANPYLLAGAVATIASSTVDEGLTLPPEVTVDPATLPGSEQPDRLPLSLDAAVAAFEADPVLPAALGEPLTQAIIAVRRAELEAFAGLSDEAVVAALRWVH